MERDLFGDCKSRSGRLFEMHVNIGKGWHVYYFRRGETTYLLLHGGSKARQQADIDHAPSLKQAIEGATNETQKFDVAEYLDSKEMIAIYLSSVLEDGDADEFTAPLGDVVRAKGISELATQTGLGRENLHKTLSGNSKPRFDTVLKITRALGIEMILTPMVA